MAEELNIDKLSEKRPEDAWTEENWQEKMQEHPFFMTQESTKGDLPPLVEALQQLKYDPEQNTKAELAENYKEDGNYNFKQKKYRWAIDAYTEGIKQNCDDNELNSILYANRAAAHFYLGNFRSSLNDSKKALDKNKKNLKALIRLTLCCFELGEYQECINMCDNELIAENDKIKKLRQKSMEVLKKIEYDRKKEISMKQKRTTDVKNIVESVKARGIKYSGSLFESIHPGASGCHVELNDFDELVWPVLFLCPEYGQSDFVERFNENDSFMEHLKVMYGENPPAWDTKGKYKAHSIKICYQNMFEDKRIEINPRDSLKSVLTSDKYVLVGAIPTFIILPGESYFDKKFTIYSFFVCRHALNL